MVNKNRSHRDEGYYELQASLRTLELTEECNHKFLEVVHLAQVLIDNRYDNDCLEARRVQQGNWSEFVIDPRRSARSQLSSSREHLRTLMAANERLRMDLDKAWNVFTAAQSEINRIRDAFYATAPNDRGQALVAALERVCLVAPIFGIVIRV